MLGKKGKKVKFCKNENSARSENSAEVKFLRTDKWGKEKAKGRSSEIKQYLKIKF